jgi:hypothetical protein
VTRVSIAEPFGNVIGHVGGDDAVLGAQVARRKTDIPLLSDCTISPVAGASQMGTRAASGERTNARRMGWLVGHRRDVR